ncbi:MAG: DUF3784 domain-containing protein [Bacteroidota bacterium]
MLFMIMLLGAILGGVGLILTVDNSRYLLSGYNTLDEEERRKIDIVNYVPFFRKFHLLLAASLIVIGTASLYLLGEEVTGIVITIYPLLGYLWFISRSSRFSTGSKRWNKIAMVVLGLMIVTIVSLFAVSLQENELYAKDHNVVISGTYGEDIPTTDIQSLELVARLPDISRKTNGFALGKIRKGRFSTSDGEAVKLILNTNQHPYILLIKKDGEKIYYSSKSRSNEEVYREVKAIL